MCNTCFNQIKSKIHQYNILVWRTIFLKPWPLHRGYV